MSNRRDFIRKSGMGLALAGLSGATITRTVAEPRAKAGKSVSK